MRTSCACYRSRLHPLVSCIINRPDSWPVIQQELLLVCHWALQHCKPCDLAVLLRPLVSVLLLDPQLAPQLAMSRSSVCDVILASTRSSEQHASHLADMLLPLVLRMPVSVEQSRTHFLNSYSKLTCIMSIVLYQNTQQSINLVVCIQMTQPVHLSQVLAILTSLAGHVTNMAACDSRQLQQLALVSMYVSEAFVSSNTSPIAFLRLALTCLQHSSNTDTSTHEYIGAVSLSAVRLLRSVSLCDGHDLLLIGELLFGVVHAVECVHRWCKVIGHLCDVLQPIIASVSCQRNRGWWRPCLYRTCFVTLQR